MGNETLPRDKFLTVNQQQKVKNKKKSRTKIPQRALQQKTIQKTKRNNLSI